MSEPSTPFTTEELFSLLARSGLLNEELLQAVHERFRDEASPIAVLNQLHDEQLLTSFQMKQLANRRHRGFFLSEKYKILEFLGQGGMSRVLLCEHLLLRRLVAVKILNKSMDNFPGAVDRLLREARATASMDHPNIARIFDVDQTGLGPCIVMEYVDGTNLHHLAVRKQPLSINRVVHYISQAATGLHQAHQAGLVHRDVKPANLMLDRMGTIKLLDLGLVRYFNPGQSDNLTQQIDPSSIIGTADYMAPEQGVESSAADIRADIYSLGYTMYFLLTQTSPAGSGSSMQKLIWHQTNQATPIRELRQGISEKLAAVLDRMIQKNPDQRYQTPEEVVLALSPWTNEAIELPIDDEMPPISAALYRLGLCPTPDLSQSIGGDSTASTTTNSDRIASIHDTLTITALPETARQRSGTKIGSTIASAETKEIRASSADTVNVRKPTPNTDMATRPGSIKADNEFRFSVPITMFGIFVALAFGLWLTQPLWWSNSFGLKSKNVEAAASTGKVISNESHSQVASRSSGEAAGVNQQEAILAGIVGSITQTNPGATVTLRAGGSTFIRPVMDFWVSTYEKQTGARIDYSPAGSNRGIDELLQRLLDFSCTNVALSDDHLTGAGVEVIHIPLALGAIVPTYNVSDSSRRPLSLRFTGAMLANIYLGRITKWNDPAIAVSNPGCDLPDQNIIVIYRDESSGTTTIWTEFLSRSHSTWREQIGIGNQVKWPVGIPADSNDGIADTVSRTEGAIGYVELSHAIANSLPVGHVKNLSGNFIEPSVAGIQAAVESLRPIPADLRYSLIDAPGANSYPIVGTCWAIVQVEQDSRRGPALVQFLKWATTDGQSFLERIKFGALPAEFSTTINRLLQRLETAN